MMEVGLENGENHWRVRDFCVTFVCEPWFTLTSWQRAKPWCPESSLEQATCIYQRSSRKGKCNAGGVAIFYGTCSVSVNYITLCKMYKNRKKKQRTVLLRWIFNSLLFLFNVFAIKLNYSIWYIIGVERFTGASVYRDFSVHGTIRDSQCPYRDTP